MIPVSLSSLFPDPPTSSLLPAPQCYQEETPARLYEHTCRCVQGSTALDTDTAGHVRGGCTGLEDNTEDNLDKVWGFLENIRDPLDPSSGCYDDVQWSDRDGRFWSSAACFQVMGQVFVENNRSLFPGSGYRGRGCGHHRSVQL